MHGNGVVLRNAQCQCNPKDCGAFGILNFTIMAILASKFSFHLQSRLFSISIPWVKRNAPVLCLKSRDHSTLSVPVRYIPKKSSKLNEFKDSDNGVLDKSLNQKAPNRNQDLYKQDFLSNDAQQGLEEGINNDVEVIQHKFMEEPEDSSEKLIQHERLICKKNAQSGRTMLDAEKMAIEFLATRSTFIFSYYPWAHLVSCRAFTAVELRKKLHGKKFPPDIVEAVIIDFQARGLINDSLYAETFSRSRWSSSSWGPRRIKQALFMKGVSEADAEKAIKLVFEDDRSGGQELKLGMSKLSMEHLLVQASKQWFRGQDVPRETRKSRIIRWLQYRGFNWGVISFILKKLESQY
ncbi:uncharacterized protein LOC8271843 isoform X2 [Ricinus communis]|uniref:uncharacterized protein LOC8271843 isoform X2 n=1 Tax=Ricinus communis TaxID=3988 RepID=UPI00201A38FE|nr:uncharacterized protein LOC8271843 isoform X2 [Ricinus communis]